MSVLIPVARTKFKLKLTKFHLCHRGEPEQLSAVYPDKRVIVVNNAMPAESLHQLIGIATASAWCTMLSACAPTVPIIGNA